MKKSAQLISVLIGGALLLQLQGCYGDFAMTKRLYAWNGTIPDKYARSAVTWVLMFISPVIGFVDFVVLNTVQFWTGKNPMAMNEGEKDIRMVHWQGKDYQLTATRNRIDVRAVVDGKLQDPVSLVYDPETASWSAVSKNQSRRIVEMVGPSGEAADFIYPDGHKQRVELAAE